MDEDLGISLEETGTEEPIEVETSDSVDGTESEPTEVEESVDEGAGEGAKNDDAYTTQFSREMRAALKAWEQENPEQAKFAKQARDNHARLFALNQIEPKGIDGVREKYALLDGLAYGEAKGPEALTAIQEELAGVEEVDNLLAAGDPKAFEALGDDFNQGLAKLAPAYLERVLKTDPVAFESALLPHFVSTLANSDMVRDFNALVDVLNAKDDPRFDDATKLNFTLQSVQKIANWLNGMQEKAGSISSAPKIDDQRTQFEQERTEFEQQKQNLYWDQNIKPTAARHENETFDRLFAPYQKRLKLDETAKNDLIQAYKAGLGREGGADNDYMRQMRIYRGQKNPDPTAVTNFVNNSINKHAKTVMEGLIKARYGAFLAGKTKTSSTVVKPGTKSSGPVASGVEIRTVKPPMNEIDHENTPEVWLAMKKYRLYNGKVIQVRPA